MPASKFRSGTDLISLLIFFVVAVVVVLVLVLLGATVLKYPKATSFQKGWGGMKFSRNVHKYTSTDGVRFSI